MFIKSWPDLFQFNLHPLRTFEAQRSHFTCKYLCDTVVLKYLVLILDLGLLLLPRSHFYKPVVSAARNVHAFQKEKGIRKVSTGI